MRSIKLTSAMLAAALLALATAALAGARVHPHLKHNHGAASGTCRVTENVAPRLITSGESVLAFGALSCRPATEGGQTVTLYEHAAGSGGFTAVGTTTTDNHGFYQIAAGPLTVNSSFYVLAEGAQSPTRTVHVTAVVTLVGPQEGKQLSISTGRRNAVTFTGTVSPNEAGAEAILQRQNSVKGNEWHRIDRSVVTSAGTFSITHVFRVPGDSNIRVLIRDGRHAMGSPSNVLTYEISQAQNPSLTIESSADPIPFGGNVTISGTVAGQPNTTVTLLGHAAHQGFVTLGTAKTNSTGAYTFLPQTPATSTFFQVQGSGRHSAVLYEGVKYVLTANVSATTIQAGQPLIFSGTVTPAEPGHIVYLERENAIGVFFHVSTLGSEGPAGEYSIAHTVYTPGTYTFRIKVPGGPDHGTAASAPFTITVTPRPPGPLAPESPGNSGLPGEGQV